MPKRKKKDTLPKDLEFDEETKRTSIVSKLKLFLAPQMRKAPITFSVGIAIILFFCYLSIIFVSLPTYPALLLILVPTLYILIRYIKLERDNNDKR